MYAVKTSEDYSDLWYRICRAIRLEQPVTIYYRETKKDPNNPKRRIPNEFELTLRTIEPYDIEQSANGDWFIRSLDRDTLDYRSWRFDRIIAYTPHRGIRTVPVEVHTTI